MSLVTIAGGNQVRRVRHPFVNAGEPAANYSIHFANDFANTAALLAYGGWNGGTSANTGQIARTANGMQYTFPDRTGDAGTRCDGYTISPGALDIRSASVFNANPALSSELWARGKYIFSSNFTTVAPGGWACGSSPSYKFLFFEVLSNVGGVTVSNRFSVYNGNEGDKWQSDGPVVDGVQAFPITTFATHPSPNHWDGAQHEIKMYAKLGAAGALKVWLDGTLLVNRSGDCSSYDIWAVKLGANMNQGPSAAITVTWVSLELWKDDNNPGWS